MPSFFVTTVVLILVLMAAPAAHAVIRLTRRIRSRRSLREELPDPFQINLTLFQSRHMA